jgi:hypothetical protein
MMSSTLARQTVPQKEDLGAIRWYLDNLLPWPQLGQGECVVVAVELAVPGWRQHVVHSAPEAETLIRGLSGDANVRGIFITQASMRSSRRAENATAFKSVWLDLDAKDFGTDGDDDNTRMQKVFSELEAFRAAVGLPQPSVLVRSGGGAHCYWVFAQPIAAERWSKISSALRDSVKQFGLRADIQCTTDAARVMRVAGTMNRKPAYGSPRLVEVAYPDLNKPLNLFSPEELETALTPFIGSFVASQPTANNLIPFPPIQGISELSAGLDVDLNSIISAAGAIPPSEIASEGNWVKIARSLAHTANLHLTQSEDLWGVLDTLSRRASGYDAIENRARWLRYISEASARQNPITLGTLFALAKSNGWSRAAVASSGNPTLMTGARRPLTGGTYNETDALHLFNSWFVIAEMSGTSIAQIEDDGSLSYLALRDFGLKVRNIFVVKSDGQGGLKNVAAEKFWLEHRDRNQRKIVFNPKAAPGASIPGDYNLWRGFAVVPKQGWNKQLRLLRHIFVILCKKNRTKFKYLIKWLAWAVQNPDRTPGTVIVLKSRSQGTGKSTLSYVMRDIFGKHARVFDNKERLFGRFNADLETVCIACAEEMVWAGDRAAADALKSLVTGDRLTLEVKNGSRWDVPNRLHVIMTTNHDHAVQAGVHDRRFFVLDVSQEKAQDATWFDPLHKDLEAGGREEFLWLLMSLNLAGWHPRQLPKTTETDEQQRMSADTVGRWIQSCIDADEIVGLPLGPTFSLNTTVTSENLRMAYAGYCSQQKIFPVAENIFGKVLTTMLGAPVRLAPTTNNPQRPRAYQVLDAPALQVRLDEYLGVS